MSIAASSAGSGQVIGFPLAEAPWYLVEALSDGSMVVGWHQGNLTDEQIPPSEIWHHPERLKEHFDRVKAEVSGKGARSNWDVPEDRQVEQMPTDDIWKQLRAP
jgi:hypothetical protein